MKVLGLDMRHIRKHELKDILVNKIKDDSIYYDISEGCNFLINNTFLLGYSKIPFVENTVYVYMVNNKYENDDGIYVRKKLKIMQAYINKFLKDKKIISYVKSDNKKAQKLNSLLFKFKSDPVRILGSSYIFYKNYKE